VTFSWELAHHYLVREEDAGRARRVIEEYRQAPGSDETAEIDISGLPPEEDQG
jgi:hypothetical protein